MTRTQSGANWSDAPSLSHLWMAALLRLAAMVVSGAVSTLQMLLSRLPRACHTDATPDRLPAAESGNQSKEQQAAEEHSPSPAGLTLRDRDLSRRSRKAKAEAIVSKHEAALTGVSHTASRHNTAALLPCWGEDNRARVTS